MKAKSAKSTVTKSKVVTDASGGKHLICPDCGTLLSRLVHSNGCPEPEEPTKRARKVTQAARKA